MAVIRYCAPVTGVSGYDRAARGYIAALLEAGYDVTVDPLWFGTSSPPARGPLADTVAELMGRDLDWDIQIVHATPDRWAEALAAKTPSGQRPRRSIGIAPFETSHLPPSWARWIRASGVDEVWATCWFNYERLTAALPSLRVTHVPHAVALLPGPLPIRPAGPTRFLAVFQWSARKNPEALLRAYFAEFSCSDRVQMTLKVYGAEDDPASRAEINRRVGRVAADMRLPPRDLPLLRCVFDLLDDAAMDELYAEADVIVTATRAEAPGLPLLEGMVRGLPCVAPAWSGLLDFCHTHPATFFPVDYDLVPCSGMPHVPWYAARQEGVEMQWAEVRLPSLRAQLRRAHLMCQDGSIEVMRKAAFDEAQNFSHAEVSRIVEAAIEAL